LIPHQLTWRAVSSRDLLPALSSRLEQVFGFDLRSLALVRIGMGAVIVADLAQRSCSLRAHYTDQGVLPRALLKGVPAPTIGLHALVDGVGPVIALGLVAIAAAVAMMVGFHTRIASIISWVLLVSLQNRNPFIYHSGDDLLRLTLFWGMFLPLGARWSVDARRRPSVAARATQFVSIGTVGLFLQLLYLFLFLFDHKLMGTAWRNGTAVYDALSVEQYRTPLGGVVLGFPAVLPFFTYAVLVQQGITVALLAAPVLSGPLRVLAVVGVIATQVGFGLCFKLGTFPWITTVALLAVLPGWFWERLGSAASKHKDRLGQNEEQISVLLRPGDRVVRFGKVAIAAAGVLSIASITLWNLSQAGAKFGVAGSEVAFEQTLLGRFAQEMRLDQRWSMFSPNPQTEDGWFVIDGTLADNARVDLFPQLVSGNADATSSERTLARGIRWEKPELISSQFGNQRWLLYFLQLVAAPSDAQLRGFGGYVCRFWNSSNEPPKSLRRFALEYMRFEHLPGGKTAPVEKIRLAAGVCPPS
jgi:hypothetical protein